MTCIADMVIEWPSKLGTNKVPVPNSQLLSHQMPLARGVHTQASSLQLSIGWLEKKASNPLAMSWGLSICNKWVAPANSKDSAAGNH